MNDGRLSDAAQDYLFRPAGPLFVETREPQYQQCFEAPPVTLGPMTGETWRRNPRRLGMMLARYKFVAKMLDGLQHVAEIGCSDAFASDVVGEVVGGLDLYDFDPVWRDVVLTRRYCKGFFVHDIDCDGPLPRGPYSGIYALDVLEHIKRGLPEHRALCNIASSLSPDGVFIAGCPSLESQAHASEISKAGHINCKSGIAFRESMFPYFRNVFLFGMNDEVLHTGFAPMCHYLFVLCCGPKR